MPGFVRSCCRWSLLGLLIWLGAASHATAADAIKIGFSMALTGPVASGGRQILQALEIWRDDVNAAGGLLGRPVELIWYDDQSNPANVPYYQRFGFEVTGEIAISNGPRLIPMWRAPR